MPSLLSCDVGRLIGQNRRRTPEGKALPVCQRGRVKERRPGTQMDVTEMKTVSLTVRKTLREEGGSAETKEYSWTDSNDAQRFHIFWSRNIHHSTRRRIPLIYQYPNCSHSEISRMSLSHVCVGWWDKAEKKIKGLNKKKVIVRLNSARSIRISLVNFHLFCGFRLLRLNVIDSSLSSYPLFLSYTNKMFTNKREGHDCKQLSFVTKESSLSCVIE